MIPPAPENHFNDYAHVVSSGTAQKKINAELEDFERQTSNQILVAVYPKMQSDSSIEDYTTRVFSKWKVGTKGNNNGASLFVFTQDHAMHIVAGYGLESVLPDATCKDILEDQIAPHFKTGDYDGGLTAGVESMIAATKSEYKGTGKTVKDSQTQTKGGGVAGIIIFIVILVIIARIRRGTMYGSGGRSSLIWPILWGLSSGGSSGGSWGGGGFGGGGGTFSGGGGMSGGGGASGSW